MTSRLHRKINSYAIGTGIEFGQAYSLPPTMTGSYQPSSGWTMSSTPTPTFESAVNPAGGAGSWKFSSGPTSGSMRLRTTDSTFMTNIYDRDFSVGFWVKLNSLPTNDTLGGPIHSFPPFNNNGYVFGVRGPDSNGKSYFYIDSNGTNTSITSVEANTTDWFYLALRHTGNQATTNAGQWLAYINGQLVSTVTNYTSTVAGSSANWGSVSQGYEFSLNISNFYITSKDVIGAAEIEEIWRVGSSSRAIKYYDGAAWQDSYDQKVWNGSAWVQWSSIPAKYWDGAAWVTI